MDDVSKIDRFKELALSPNGRDIVYVFERQTGLMAWRPVVTSLWYVRPGLSPQRLTGEVPVSAPQWSPDGKRLAYIENDPTQGTLLRIAAVDLTGATPALRPLADRAVCEKASLAGFSWAPEGRRIGLACMHQAPPMNPQTEKTIIVASRSQYFDHPDIGTPWSTLEILQVSSGRILEVPLKRGGERLLITAGYSNVPRAVQWTRDGAAIIVTATAKKQGPRGASSTRERALYRVPVSMAAANNAGDDGEAVLLTAVRAPYDAPALNPDGKSVLSLRYERYKYLPHFDADPVLFTFNASAAPSGEGAQATRSVTLQRFFLARNGRYDMFPFHWVAPRSVLGLGAVNATAQLLDIDPTTGKRERVTPADMNVSDFSVTPDGKTIATIMGNSDTPDEIFIRQGQDGRFVQLTRNGESIRQRFVLGSVKEVTWPSRDGTFQVHGFLMTPPNYDPQRPYPFIVDIHGGPGVYFQNQFDLLHFWNTNASAVPGEVFAARGYVVLYPNPRGDQTYEHSGRTSDLSDWSKVVDDIQFGVETMVERGIADPKRLGITGASFGGWATVQAISKTQMFKAAVANDAPVDLKTQNGLDYYRSNLGNLALFVQMFGGAPWDVPFAEIDPSTIRTPVLLRFGAKPADPAHPESFYESGAAAYAYLDCRGIPSEMLVHPQEGHGIFDSETLRDYIKRTVNWFDYWLNDEPYQDAWRREEFDAWKRNPGQLRACYKVGDN